jgi:hypothetical protein
LRTLESPRQRLTDGPGTGMRTPRVSFGTLRYPREGSTVQRNRVRSVPGGRGFVQKKSRYALASPSPGSKSFSTRARAEAKRAKLQADLDAAKARVLERVPDPVKR